jgi:hypothetical protein
MSEAREWRKGDVQFVEMMPSRPVLALDCRYCCCFLLKVAFERDWGRREGGGCVSIESNQRSSRA